MAFMAPEAERFNNDDVREFRLLCSEDCRDLSGGMCLSCCADYAEDHAGWYGRLSAAGYMDATDWQGPFATAEAALAAIMDAYGVDENGDDVNGDEVAR